MRRSRENNIRDNTRGRAEGASLANSPGCRFPDRAAGASPGLCAYSRASREESVAVKKNERIKRTFIWEMMRNQDASAAQWRGRCCIREEMKRAEGILEGQDKATAEGAARAERETTVKECKYKDALHPQFRSALQSII